MAIYVRGSNPIWLLADLTGHLFDDTFYMFVLENTLPYVPSTVYHTVSGIPWTQPIQFLANGTLPIDIFWDPNLIYRLEFRKGPTQTDPLIYEVNNYSPSGNGLIPDTGSVVTDNQITNSQFSLLSFNSPYVQTNITNPDPIEVAPGWFLNLTGTGNVRLERASLSASLANPTNAPYALRITLSGDWTGTPYLSQRFNENGMLWSTFVQPRYVSNSITARVQGASQSILAQMYDSMGMPLTTVLSSTPLTNTFVEYVDHGLMPATSNTDVPPDAWVEYRLFLPTAIDLYISSIQLVSSNTEIDFQYIQDTIQRQQDFTFHYYRDSLLRQQKECLLSGWDFGLNPWQSHTTATTNLATFGYVCDQTIAIQQAYVASASGNNISTERASAAENYGLKVTAVTDTNQFALVQYIDAATIRNDWGKKLSSMLQLSAQLQNPDLVLKMKLIYRATLAPALSQSEPIASWTAAGEPVFSAGWTALSAINDPSYTLVNGANTLIFEGFELPASTDAAMMLGIVIYTVDSMVETGTADNIIFEKCSLVQNDFAIDTPSLTFDETLRRCQFYYETSYNPYSPPGTNTGSSGAGFMALMDTLQVGGDSHVSNSPFRLSFSTLKRIANPTITLYNITGTINQVLAELYYNASLGTTANIASTAWTRYSVNAKGANYVPANTASLADLASVGLPSSGAILFHYVVDARLGITHA